jgi:hypothetical protein
MEGREKRTSSLLLCFCLLVLIEVPASLAAVVLCVVSSTGLGMFEEELGVAGLLVVKGMAPRPWLRPGVPLIVPGLADMANAASPMVC